MKGFKQEISSFEAALDGAVGDNRPPIAFIGGAGSGKTTLRRRCEAILQERRTRTFKTERERIASASLLISPEDRMVDRLISIRVQMAGTGGFDFMAFDWAFMRWFQMTYPDADVRLRHPNLFKAGGHGTAGEILNWLSEAGKEYAGDLLETSFYLVPGLSLLNKIRVGLSEGFIKWTRHRAVRPLLEHLETLSDEELHAKLPELLGYDLEQACAKASQTGTVKSVLLIDDYHKLRSTFEYRGSDDDWVAQILQFSPSTQAVLFSNSPVSAHKAPMDLTHVILLTGFDEKAAHSFLTESGMDPEFADLVTEVCASSPLYTRIALDVYNETGLGSAPDRNAALEGFDEKLATEVLSRLYTQVTRGMSSGAVRELILAGLLKEFDRASLLEAARHVLGGDAHIEVSRLLSSGVITHDEKEPGWLIVHPHLQYAVRGDHRHGLIRGDILERLANHFLAMAVQKLEEGAPADARVAFERALEWVDTWCRKSFEKARSVIATFLEEDRAESAYKIGQKLVSHYIRREESDDIWKEFSPHQLDLIKLGARAMQNAAIRRTNFGAALQTSDLLITASRYRGQLDYEDLWTAARISIRIGAADDFRSQIQWAFDFEMKKATWLLNELDEEVVLPDGNTLSLEQIADAHTTADVPGIRDIAREKDLSRFGSMIAGVDTLLRDMEVNTHASEPLFEAKKKIVSLARDNLEIGKRIYLNLGEILRDGILHSSDASSMVSPMVPFLRQYPEAKEALALEEHYCILFEFGKEVDKLDQAALKKVAHDLLLNDIKRSEYASGMGNSLLSLFRLLKDSYAHENILELFKSLEGMLSKTGYIQSEEADHLMLANLFARYAETLSRAGRDHQLYLSKLKFAVQQFALSHRQATRSDEERAAFLEYLKTKLGVTVELGGDSELKLKFISRT